MVKLKQKFEENGYLIKKGLISSAKIDNLLNELRLFKNNNQLYYSQSEHNWRRAGNNLDEFNLLQSSFNNFTDLIWAQNLAKAGRIILQSREIQEILQAISGEKDFSMWQNMLFDKSTGTIDHIDTWYLDTNPMGKLIAVWVALEDIDGAGGSFHVYPYSHKSNDMSWMGLNHDQFKNWTDKFAKNYEKKPILLKKGDALFWHPSLIHGSSSQKISAKSRKSITAHYYPINYLKGGAGQNDEFNTKEYNLKIKKQYKSIRRFGYPIFSDKSKRFIFAYSIQGIIRNITGIYNKPKMLMKRKEY